jgi:hypothetical protein
LVVRSGNGSWRHIFDYPSIQGNVQCSVMSRKSNPKPDDPERSKRFIEAEREAGAGVTRIEAP